MLFAAFVQSPHAHARIRSIDVAAARGMPGVKAVLTGADIGRRCFGRQLYDWPVLAVDVVRFAGDRVAAVAAETREAAECAARAIDVDYEELPALLDAREALAEDAPVLHPEWASYFFSYLQGKPSPTYAHPNIHGNVVLTRGEHDLESIFAGAHRVFEHHFETPRQHAAYIEPQATLVWIDGSGIVHVQSPNKSPFALRRQLAKVAGLREDEIVVETSAIGGDFGGKGLTADDFPCYFLARATGRPVRYVQSYADALRNVPPRHRSFVTLRTAVGCDGRFLAHTSTILYDGGAYAAGKPIPTLIPGNGCGAIPYHVPNVRIDISSVYTNTVPAGHVRGPGEIQTFFAWEQHVELMAVALGYDVLDFRRRNVVGSGQSTLTGEDVHGAPMADAVLAAVQRERGPAKPNRAHGMAFICAHTGGGRTGVRLRLHGDGRMEAIVGVPDQGVGVMTVIRRIIAAEFAIDPDAIAVRRGNTDDALADPGSGHSRVTHIVGRAAQDACAKLRDLLAAGSGGFAERAAHACAGGPIAVEGTFVDPAGDGGSDLTFAACSVEIEVDRETGSIRVHDALMVADVGQIINPIAHQGQIDGGFVFGLGGALMEELPIDEHGRVTTLNLGEYKIPTMRDIPPLRTILLQSLPGDGPFGAKMIGELANVAVVPAIANAIFHAAGVRLHSFPATSERVYAAINVASGR